MSGSDMYVSLDIGTSTTKVIIAEHTDGKLNVIGVGRAPSDGIRRGTVVDIEKTVESIRSAVSQAEDMVGVTIQGVVVSMLNYQTNLSRCHGMIAIKNENNEITTDDIQDVIEAAQAIAKPSDREKISFESCVFKVDGVEGISDPTGMFGVRLEVEGTLITGSKSIVHNILRCVERAGLEVTGMVLQPLAAAETCLTKDDKDFGTVLIDIGGGITSVGVFDQGQLVDAFAIPVGGSQITKDISIGLNISLRQAEQIKLEHGYAFSADASENETFEIDVIGSSKALTINQTDLSVIIEARLEEILVMVDDELTNAGLNQLPNGFVLTGGTTVIPGMMEIAEQVFDSRVRIVYPDYIGVRHPSLSTAVGLISHEIEYGQSTEVDEYEETGVREQQQDKVKEPKAEEDKLVNKMKRMFGSLFE